MTQSIEKLLVQIDATTETLRREMKRAEDATGQWQRKTDTQLKTFDRRFTDTLKKAGDSARNLGGPLGGIANSLTAIVSPAGAAAAGLAAMTAAIASSTRVAGQFQQIGLRTEAVIKATGAAAGFTAQQIADLSKRVAGNTLADALGVEAAAQKLLTFRGVAGDVFTRTIELSQDLAAVGFGSVESAAVQLGKALENPVQGVSALAEVGVSFSASQRDLIRSLVEANDVLAAQELILAAVAGQVSGAGVAEAGGLAGGYDALAGNVQTFLQNIGNSGPIQAATAALNALAGVVESLNNALFPTLTARLSEAQAELDRLESRPANRRNVGAQNLRAQALREEIAEVEALIAARRADEDQARQQSATVQATLAAERAAGQAAASADRERVQAQREAEAAARRAGAAASAQAQRQQALIAGIEREIDLIQFRTAAQRSGAAMQQRVEVLIEAENLALANNIALGSAQYQQLLSLVEVRARLTAEQERAARIAQTQQRAATQQAADRERAAEAAIRVTERRIDSVVEFGASAFAEMFEETGRGWSGLMDSMLSALRQTFARMAAEAVLRPIIAPVIGAFAGGTAAAAASGGLGGGIPPIGSVSGLFSNLGNLSLLGSGGATAGTNLAFSSFGRSLGLSQGIVGATGPELALTGLGGSVSTGLNNLANPLTGLSGFVGNFGANLLLGDRGIGGNVGGTLGGLAGGAIFGPLGALGGAFLGNAVGGLFGNNKPSNFSQGSTISADGISQFGMTGKKFDQETRNTADGIAATLGAVLGTLEQATGARLSGSVGFELGGRDQTRIFRNGEVVARSAVGDPQAALQAALGVTVDALGTDIPAELSRVLRSLDTTDPERALADVAFAAALTTGKDLFPEPQQITAIEQAMDGLDAAMVDARATAARLGLAFEDVERQGAAAADGLRATFTDDIALQIQRLTDPVQAQLAALEDAAEERLRIATRLGTDIAQVERLNALERLDVVRQSSTAALTTLQTAVAAERGTAQATLDAELFLIDARRRAAEDRRQIEADALSAEIAARSDALSSITALSQAIASGVAGLRVTIPAFRRETRAAAQAALGASLEAARGGTLPDADAIAGTLRDLAPDSATFATRADFLRDALLTQKQAQELQAIVDAQLGVDEQMLIELQQRQVDAEMQHTALMARLDAEAEAATARFASESARLDALVVTAQRDLEIALGTYEATLSVAQAIDRLAEVMGSARAAAASTTLPGGDFVGDLYRTVLGRAGSADEVAFYQAQLAAGASQSDIAARFYSSPEFRSIRGFADGGDFMGGMRIVGERGPELEMTGPSRIISAEKLFAAVSGDKATASEVRALRADMQTLMTSINRHTHDTAQRLRRWDAAGLPTERVEV